MGGAVRRINAGVGAFSRSKPHLCSCSPSLRNYISRNTILTKVRKSVPSPLRRHVAPFCHKTRRNIGLGTLYGKTKATSVIRGGNYPLESFLSVFDFVLHKNAGVSRHVGPTWANRAPTGHIGYQPRGWSVDRVLGHRSSSGFDRLNAPTPALNLRHFKRLSG
jgi:hypothetical protein